MEKKILDRFYQYNDDLLKYIIIIMIVTYISMHHTIANISLHLDEKEH